MLWSGRGAGNNYRSVAEVVWSRSNVISRAPRKDRWNHVIYWAARGLTYKHVCDLLGQTLLHQCSLSRQMQQSQGVGRGRGRVTLLLLLRHCAVHRSTWEQHKIQRVLKAGCLWTHSSNLERLTLRLGLGLGLCLQTNYSTPLSKRPSGILIKIPYIKLKQELKHVHFYWFNSHSGLVSLDV